MLELGFSGCGDFYFCGCVGGNCGGIDKGGDGGAGFFEGGNSDCCTHFLIQSLL